LVYGSDISAATRSTNKVLFAWSVVSPALRLIAGYEVQRRGVSLDRYLTSAAQNAYQRRPAAPATAIDYKT
jgi:hypothetical protein